MDTVGLKTLRFPGRSLTLIATLSALQAGLAATPPAAACSRSLINSQGQSAVGRTMDLYISDKARIVVDHRGTVRVLATDDTTLSGELSRQLTVERR